MNDIERLRIAVQIGNSMQNPQFRRAVLLSISSVLRARYKIALIKGAAQ